MAKEYPSAISIKYVALSADDQASVLEVACNALGGNNISVRIEDFLESAAVNAQNLPRNIRAALYDFRLHEREHAICIKGPIFSDQLLGPTPRGHRPGNEPEYVLIHDAVHLLFAALLGEPFSWSTIQNGYIVNDVMPIHEHRDAISSSGWETTFDLHTEDAFHRCAGDYLGLMCLRNPTRATTTLAFLPSEAIPQSLKATLFEPRFIVGANLAQKVPTVSHCSPLLWGNPNSPYFRINLNNTQSLDGDSTASEALRVVTELLKRHSCEVTLEPGDCWYIDNYRVAHGRGSFVPSFDGHDRWLKRLYITSSFRMSAHLRSGSAARVINPGLNLLSE